MHLASLAITRYYRSPPPSPALVGLGVAMATSGFIDRTNERTHAPRICFAGVTVDNEQL